MKYNRHILSLIPGLGFPAVLTYAYHKTMDFPPLVIWLLTLNLMLLALMGKDKIAATKKTARTPEFTLLLLAFLGATPALLIGRKLFNHKTAKKEFIYAMVGTIAAQAVAIWYFWPQLRQWL
jgi:uncharacterized membrane protein YsdA (DUF1294 family)